MTATAMLEDPRHTDLALERGARLHDEAARLVGLYLRGRPVQREIDVAMAFGDVLIRKGIGKYAADAMVDALAFALRGKHESELSRQRAADAFNELQDEAVERLAERLGAM